MCKLASNAELYSFLQQLSDRLRSIGELSAAEDILLSSRFVSGSQSEFLHEARHALAQVRLHGSTKLDVDEIQMLSSVIDQLDTAFRDVGGV